MSRSMPRASGYFHTHYAQDLQLIQTRTERLAALAFVALLIAVPFVASPFLLDLCSQVFLASIGALSLMLLTGYAGRFRSGMRASSPLVHSQPEFWRVKFMLRSG